MLKTCINRCLADRRLIISLLAGAAFPPRYESSSLETWSGRGAVASGMGSAVAGGQGQVLPGSARSRQRPELAAISARCWRPAGASTASQGSATAPERVHSSFQLVRAGCSQGIDREQCMLRRHLRPLRRGHLPHPATPQRAEGFCSQGSHGCGEGKVTIKESPLPAATAKALPLARMKPGWAPTAP